jgi:hypothetical protein
LVSWYELTASTVFIASRGACGLTRGNNGWGTSGAERIGEAHLDRILMSSIEHADRNNSTLVMFQQPKYTSATTKTRSSKAWKLGFPIIPSKIYAFSRVFWWCWSFPWLSCVSMVVQATKSTSPQSSTSHDSLNTSYNESPHCSDHLKAFTRTYTCLDTLRTTSSNSNSNSHFTPLHPTH